MARQGRGRLPSYSEQIEAQAEGIDGNAPLLDLDDEDGDLLSQVQAVACCSLRWLPATVHFLLPRDAR